MGLPNEIHPFLIAGNDANQYKITNSLRFRASASAFLTRTNLTSSSRTTWTWSGWVKRGALSYSTATLFGGYISNFADRSRLYFESDDTLNFIDISASSVVTRRTTNAKFRDPSAWYHVVCTYDTTNATAASRIRLYVNNTLQSYSTATDPSLNYASGKINDNVEHAIGRLSTEYFDGYLAEVNFVDGQALDPSYFGLTDSLTNQWVPKKYTGTYGTNGFYLPFNDATSTTTLGYDRQLGMSDSSKNNWTLNNISVTSGVTYDVMRDSPTSYDDGGNNRGNYCVVNPLALGSVSAPINGNLTQTLSGLNGTGASGTFVVTSGKWYWEVVSNATTNAAQYVGLIRGALSSTAGPTTNPSGFYYGSSGNNREDGTTVTYGNTWLNLGVDYIIGVALDCDSNTVVFYVNNVSQGTRTLPSTTSGWKPQLGFNSSSGSALMNYNFGQRPFSYTPPAGFLALNSYNLPNPSLPLV